MFASIGREVVVTKAFSARNVEGTFNTIRYNRDCDQVTDLFEIKGGGGVKEEVVDAEEEIILGVDVDVSAVSRGVEETVINGVFGGKFGIAEGVTEGKLGFAKSVTRF